jgi:poly(glycerol-phosphate) alpha-glucosyltransferase
MAQWLHREIQGFDLVHVHAVWNFPTYFAMRTAWQAGVPSIVAPQGSLEPWALEAGSWQRRWYARRVERPYLNRAARLQALTRAEIEQCRAFGLTAPTSLIPNAVDEDWLGVDRRSLAADLGLSSGTRTLLFLSRLHPKKGLDILVRAFAGWARKRSDVHFVIAGGDAGSGYFGMIARLIGELGIEGRCHLLGEVKGERKRELLAGADAYALTSHSEGQPVAVLEAMACGVPVLITPGCNLPEVQERKAGLTVDPTVERVAAGLHDMFASPETMACRGAAGRELVRDRFTWPRVARQTIEVYKDMLDSHSRRRQAATA